MRSWNQHFTFSANFVDILAFIDSLGARSYEVEFQGHIFACLINEDIDHSALSCLTLEMRAWWQANGHRQTTKDRVPPCARTQLRLVQNRIDECIGYYSVKLVDPTAVVGAPQSEQARCEATIHAFMAKQWSLFISLWLQHSKQPRQSPSTTPPRVGRPRDPNDDWAYEQVVLRGRPRPEVYREWLGRIGERAGQLADPQDSFRRAIAARRR